MCCGSEGIKFAVSFIDIEIVIIPYVYPLPDFARLFLHKLAAFSLSSKNLLINSQFIFHFISAKRILFLWLIKIVGLYFHFARNVAPIYYAFY